MPKLSLSKHLEHFKFLILKINQMKYLTNTLILSIIFLFISCSNEAPKTEGEKESISIPVKVKTLTYTNFDHYIEVTGYVEPIEYAFISPEVPGQIKSINVVEGENVTKGQILVLLNTAAYDGQIRAIKSQLELANITYQKQDELWNNQKVGSEIQFLQAKAQKENLESQLKGLESQKDMAIIEAPFSGVVDKINLKVGELASPGMKLLEMVNLNQMKITAEISEHLLPVIHKGDSVLISFPTYENIQIKTPIYRTGNIINPANRTFTVEARIKNIDGQLKPFMVSTLKIKDFSLKQAITVPSIIVKKDFDKEFVFIAEHNDSSTFAKKVYIETGRSYKDETVVTKGLETNDEVIVMGYNTVTGGSVIEIQK